MMEATELNGVNGHTNESNGAPQSRDLAIALEPCDLNSIPSHIKTISELGGRLADGDLQVRLKLLKSARSLVAALETPRETMIKHCWAQPAAFTAIEIGIQIDLFKVLARDNGSSKKAASVAQELGVDPNLVARLLRHLGAMNYVKEAGPDEYEPTNFSTALNIPVVGDGYPLITEDVRIAVDKFPQFLKKTGYKTPSDALNSPYQYAHGSKLNMLEHLELDAKNFQRFHNHMGAYRQGRDSWMDPGFFPVQDRLVNGAKTHSGAAFLVDIGGSLGHDLEEFARKHPKVEGRLILQDLPSVLAQINQLDDGIERMPYDFYTEQPIKGSSATHIFGSGARAYYMHSVLHDWPDDVNRKILARVTEAMERGYSKLLVNENVIPATGADWQATAEDIMVMITSSSLERTEGNWRDLLEGAGLKICNIWSTDNALESLIECELS
ncbi:hydroxyindole O-methyltransferase [Polyplosphaeria fusca]|uniref:Hydroxyindole O-methyltransferase n=1 Tax=Polyplosphaeria fusca TaxID=682080 RepID=A0A9P4UX45_9PLEO|nr:hydroxyindole O-methyltransferase [Polyplosphaeria fusca]